MIDTYAIRSLGLPYFAAIQPDQAFMQAPYTFSDEAGGIEMLLTFRLDALPVQRLSADEAHVLFAYSDIGPIQGDLAWIGVTPSGRICGAFMDGSVIQSSTGLLTPGSVYTVRLEGSNFPPGDATDTLRLALGTDLIGFPTLYEGSFVGARAQAVPQFYGQMILFNSVKGTTRCACTIFLATIRGKNMVDDNMTAQWPINERAGDVLRWQEDPLVEDDNEFAQDFTLSMGPKPPTTWPLVYGDPSYDSGGFEWEYLTDWTKIDPPVTEWQKNAVGSI